MFCGADVAFLASQQRRDGQVACVPFVALVTVLRVATADATAVLPSLSSPSPPSSTSPEDNDENGGDDRDDDVVDEDVSAVHEEWRGLRLSTVEGFLNLVITLLRPDGNEPLPLEQRLDLEATLRGAGFEDFVEDVQTSCQARIKILAEFKKRKEDRFARARANPSDDGGSEKQEKKMGKEPEQEKERGQKQSQEQQQGQEEKQPSTSSTASLALKGAKSTGKRDRKSEMSWWREYLGPEKSAAREALRRTAERAAELFSLIDADVGHDKKT